MDCVTGKQAANVTAKFPAGVSSVPVRRSGRASRAASTSAWVCHAHTAHMPRACQALRSTGGSGSSPAIAKVHVLLRSSDRRRLPRVPAHRRRQGFGALSAADQAAALAVFGARLVRLRCASAVLLSWPAPRPEPRLTTRPSQANDKEKVAAKEAAVAAKAAAKVAKAAARAAALLKTAADKAAKQAKKAAAAEAKKAAGPKPKAAKKVAAPKRAREDEAPPKVAEEEEEAEQAPAPAPKMRARVPKAAGPAAEPAVGLRRSARLRG